MSLAPVLWVLENMQECLLKATDFGKHLRLKSDFRQTDLEQLSSGEVANSRL